MHVFIQVRHVVGQSTYLSCACQSEPSWGWLASWILLPYVLHPPSGAAGIWPLGCLFLQICIPTTWLFSCAGLSSVSDMEIYMRDLICSWGSFSFSMSPKFLEGVLKWSENISNSSHAIWIVCTIRYTWGSLILSPGLWPSDRLSGVTSFGILIVPKFLIFLGFSKVIRMNSPQLRVNSQEVCYMSSVLII